MKYMKLLDDFLKTEYNDYLVEKLLFNCPSIRKKRCGRNVNYSAAIQYGWLEFFAL